MPRTPGREPPAHGRAAERLRQFEEARGIGDRKRDTDKPDPGEPAGAPHPASSERVAESERGQATNDPAEREDDDA